VTGALLRATLSYAHTLLRQAGTYRTNQLVISMLLLWGHQIATVWYRKRLSVFRFQIYIVLVATQHCGPLPPPCLWNARACSLVSRSPMREAKLNGLHTVLVLRDHDWAFPRISAVAAMEWARESGITVMGPSVAWCKQWASFTATCREINGACRCGMQSEWDSLGSEFNVETMPTFYEVSVAKVTETGFNPRESIISESLTASQYHRRCPRTRRIPRAHRELDDCGS
jgi:hypothetical protein